MLPNALTLHPRIAPVRNTTSTRQISLRTPGMVPQPRTSTARAVQWPLRVLASTCSTYTNFGIHVGYG